MAAQMDGLRKAPGQMGELKRVQLDEQGCKHTSGQAWGRHYMTADWAYMVQEPTSRSFHTFPLHIILRIESFLLTRSSLEGALRCVQRRGAGARGEEERVGGFVVAIECTKTS